MESVFRPEQWVRGFSDDHIVSHLKGVLAIVERVEEETDGGVPADLRVHVFGVAQAMRASMQPRNPRLVAAPAMAIPKGG